MAQDDYYYEIQLSNKQLVFYFLAGSAFLILSFLAGVKVGRGVEETASADGRSRVLEDRIVPEEPAVKPAPQAAEDLTYAQRLEGDKVEDVLEKPSGTEAKPAVSSGAATPLAVKPSPAASAPASPKPNASTAPARAARTAASPPPVAKPSPTAVKSEPAPVAAGTFTIQVGAFKDRGSAESVVTRLKSKGYAAYVVAPNGPEGGLFNVRVGSFPARPEAERTQSKLRDEEKFKPFIVKN